MGVLVCWAYVSSGVNHIWASHLPKKLLFALLIAYWTQPYRSKLLLEEKEVRYRDLVYCKTWIDLCVAFWIRWIFSILLATKSKKKCTTFCLASFSALEQEFYRLEFPQLQRRLDKMLLPGEGGKGWVELLEGKAYSNTCTMYHILLKLFLGMYSAVSFPLTQKPV